MRKEDIVIHANTNITPYQEFIHGQIKCKNPSKPACFMFKVFVW